MMPGLEAAVAELQIQLGAALRDLARYERKERHMAEVRIDSVRQRRGALAAALSDADRRIRFLEDLALDRDLNLDEQKALKQAQDDLVKLQKDAVEEYKGDPAHVLDVGDRAIPDNPLNAPASK